MDKKKSIVIGVAGLILLTSLFSRTPQAVETVDTSSNMSSLQNLFGFNQNLQENIIQEGDASNRILVIPIEGALTADNQHILDSIEKIRTDETIKAVLLSIDSPGGSVYPTREIYDRLKEVQAERDFPIYTSMGSQAASGGYYLAVLGEKIYANEETWTGSISVIASYYTFEELFNKVGIAPVTIKTGELKGMGTADREPTDEEREVIQSLLDETYDRFVDVIVEGRGMDEDKVRELADGRTYSGIQAKANGLIDEFGYQKDALAGLMADKGLEGAQVFSYVEPTDINGLFSGVPFLNQLGQDTSPAAQLDQVIEKVESMGELKLEYRMQGGN